MHSIFSLRQSRGSARSISSHRTPHRTRRLHRLIDSLEPRTLLYTPSTIINPAEDSFAAFMRTIEAQTGGEIAGFGRAVVNVGDLNADGADDLAIGAPGGGSAVGLVQLFSGKSGALLWTVAGADVGFGRAITAISDVTSDGVADIAIGSPLHADTGAVFIYNGASGALVSTILGSTFNAISGARFGWSLAAGLFNPDETQDLAIGAPTDGDDGAGRIYVVDGTDHSTAFTFAGSRETELFGWCVKFIEEPAPGPQLLAIGGPGWPVVNHRFANLGRVSIVGYTGEYKYWVGAANNEFLGFSLASLPPTISGVRRIAVGSPGGRIWLAGETSARQNVGIVSVYEIRTELQGPVSYITTAEAGSRFGCSLDSDATGLIIGAPGAVAGGKVYIHGLPLSADQISDPNDMVFVREIQAQGVVDFGTAVALGDFNADGTADGAIASGLSINGISTDPAESTSGAVRLYSAVEFSDEHAWLQSSSNLRFSIIHPDGSAWYYLVGDGAFVPILNEYDPSSVRFVEVDNSGRVLISRSGAVWMFANGSLTNLSAAITSYVGTPHGWTFDAAMTPRAILADGSVLVERLRNNSGTPNQLVNRTIWRIDAGTATYLWQGEYHAHSAYGAVGRRLDSYNAETNDRTWTTMLYRVSTGVEEIASIQNAAAITDDGVIVGVDYATNSFVKRATDATLTTLFAVADVDYADTLWPKALDSDGRLLWFQAEDKSKYAGEHWYWILGSLQIFDPIKGSSSDAADGAIPTYRTTFGTVMISMSAAFTPDHGFIVNNTDPYDSIDSAYYKAGFDPRLTTPAPGTTPATATAGSWTAMTFVNQLGRITLAIDEGDGVWKLRYAAYNEDLFEGWASIIGWVDPLTNRPQFATLSSNGQPVHIASFPEVDGLTTRKPYWLWEVRAMQITDDSGNIIGPLDQLSTDMAVLIGPDNLNILAFRTTAGNVLLIGQRDHTIHNPFTFTYFYDLYGRELSPKGNGTPVFQGNISAFVSPWGSHNITGVDENGHVWTLWTSPEFVGWQSTDLTAWIGADPFAGNVSSFITSWNAFNMTGLDNSGRLVTLWWAPELGPGNWRVDAIGEGQTAWDTNVAIDSWFNQSEQSLNFVGTNESGRVTVYAWSTTNQTWRAEYPENDATAQPVHRFAPDRYSQKNSRLVGINDDNHVIWAYRDPSAWISYDLLMLLE